MGYTIYWHIYKGGDWTPREWNLLCQHYKGLKEMGSMYCPNIFEDRTESHDEISFNGSEGESCEDFTLYQNGFSGDHYIRNDRHPDYAFYFVKTDRQDYTRAVLSLLEFAHKLNPSSISIHDDDGKELDRVPQ
jgi:hypothetical protein